MPLALTPLFPALLLLALPLPPGRVASTERFCLSQRELRVMGVALGSEDARRMVQIAKTAL